MSRIFPKLEEKPKNGTEAGIVINYPISGREILTPEQYKFLSFVPTILELAIPKTESTSPRERDKRIDLATQLALVERNPSRANSYTRSPEYSSSTTEESRLERVIIGVNLYEISNDVYMRFMRELAKKHSETGQTIYLEGQPLNSKAAL